MRVRRSRLGTWGRRNVLMMTFWYFALIFSAFLYYTYAKWRPANMYSALADGPVTAGEHRAGAVPPGESRATPGSTAGELRRILGENASLAGWRNSGGDPRAVAGFSDAADTQVHFPGGNPSADGTPNRSGRTAHRVAADRTRNANVPGGGERDRVTGENSVGRRVVQENAVELTEVDIEEEEEEEDEEVRDPVTYSVDLTTVGFENATLKPPLAAVVEGYERVPSAEALRLHCGRCSVVSSSGHLINQSRGRDIDSAQCVLRMNSAPIVGYVDDVGARTTVRVIGHVNIPVLNSRQQSLDEIFVNRSSRAEKVVIPWLHSVQLNKETNRYYQLAQNFSKAFPEVEFYFLTPEKSKLAEEIFKSETGLTTREANTWLTTGWMTLLFAIDVCDEIDIYGLVDESHCRDHPKDSTPYHYYDPTGNIECKYYHKSEERLTGGHLFITEKAVFARWAHRFNLRFHSPAWNLTASPPANLSLSLETPFLKRFYEAKRNNQSAPAGTRARRVVRRIVRRVVRKVPVAAKKTKL